MFLQMFSHSIYTGPPVCPYRISMQAASTRTEVPSTTARADNPRKLLLTLLLLLLLLLKLLRPLLLRLLLQLLLLLLVWLPNTSAAVRARWHTPARKATKAGPLTLLLLLALLLYLLQITWLAHGHVPRNLLGRRRRDPHHP